MKKIKAVGFDNSSFERKKSNRKNISKEEEKFHGFYSPLGVGVVVENLEIFNKSYLEKITELKKDFKLTSKRKVFSSYSLKTELGINKAIPFCDQLIAHLQPYIELVHFTYTVIPPTEISTVCVGGRKCPER